MTIPFTRHRSRRAFGPSAAALILGLTGGSDDEWWRIQRNWRVAWLGSRVVFFAVRLVIPMILIGLARRWANGRLLR
ncbi:MAG: hypothetical protein JO057_09275 [Chloroflexi bacterium]|nr:hypothetical protein [Chloroflexota bacterium]